MGHLLSGKSHLIPLIDQHCYYDQPQQAAGTGNL